MQSYSLAALFGVLFVAGCNTTGSPAKVIIDGRTLKVDSFMALNPDCSSLGPTAVRVIQPPRHSTVDMRPGQDFSRFAKENIRAHCNASRAPATLVYYTPSAGYKGSDAFEVEAVFANGSTRKATYQLEAR
jgi:hypothetical protein